MYRVRLGAEVGKNTAAVMRDMGYTGSDYRLKKARENAAGYTTRQIEESLLCLAALDRSLKRSALPDKFVLMEAALAELICIREGAGAA